MSYKGSIAEAFENDDKGIYKGKLIHRYLNFPKFGYHRLDFKVISKDSKHIQAIILIINMPFKGEIYIGGKKERKPKGRFPTITLLETQIPDEFSIYVHIEEGGLDILNGCVSPLFPTRYCNMMIGGCAIIIEELGEDHYRLNCNDIERDDDFNDFVFEVKFTEIADADEWLKLAKQKE